MQNGKPRKVTVEEALQRKIYQKAIAGNRAAQREVRKMIDKREKWLASKKPKQHQDLEWLIELTDPRNADGALLLLGIAERDTSWNDPHGGYEHLLLRPWAVQAALSRPGRRRLWAQDISEIKRCTREPERFVGPKGRRMSRTSDVGYGKPPASTKFQEGRSGKSKGRPKGRHNRPPYDAVLGQKATIKDEG